jgi:hypothetical protein
VALTERIEIGKCEVLADKQLQVRTDTVIERDGVEISRAYHRHVVAPGDDLSGQHADVQIVANAVHTSAVIAAYRAKVAASLA